MSEGTVQRLEALLRRRIDRLKGLLLHRSTVGSIDPSCPDCKVIIAVLEANPSVDVDGMLGEPIGFDDE